MKLIALDLDGTLLNSGKVVPKEMPLRFRLQPRRGT